MAKRSACSLTTRFIVTRGTLLIDLIRPRSVLSSAPRGGGLIRARYIINHQVPAHPIAARDPLPPRTWKDPSRYLGRVAASLGAESRCVALMTAVPMKQVVLIREEWAGIWIEGFITVGVTNAVKAGEPGALFHASGERNPQPPPGTINIILVTNARLTSAALVGVVQVATESKTAALVSRRIRSQTGRSYATGTGTDALVIAGGDGPAIRYSGTHTKFGAMVGQLVERGVLEGLLRSEQWPRRRAARVRFVR
ncbi:MAG: adenosylcobinamide amidohydrolase [Nitrospiraceae bacterium]